METTYLRVFAGGLWFLLETEAIAGIVEAGVKREGEIPVYSLGKLTSLKESGGKNSYVLILFDGGKGTGISVEEADKIRTVKDGGILPLPREVLCKDNRYLRGAVRPEEAETGLEYVLDLASLLERKRTVEPDCFI